MPQKLKTHSRFLLPPSPPPIFFSFFVFLLFYICFLRGDDATKAGTIYENIGEKIDLKSFKLRGSKSECLGRITGNASKSSISCFICTSPKNYFLAINNFQNIIIIINMHLIEIFPEKLPFIKVMVIRQHRTSYNFNTLEIRILAMSTKNYFSS